MAILFSFFLFFFSFFMSEEKGKHTEKKAKIVDRLWLVRQEVKVIRRRNGNSIPQF